MNNFRFPSFMLVCFAGWVSVCAGQESWPQWRGPELNNISEAGNLPVEFNQDKNLAWRYEMPGPGGASPVVWQDHVFISSVHEEDGGLVLLCLNDQGELKWQKELKGKNRSIRMDDANSASASPCTDGEHVWVTTSAGFLQCFDFQGNEVWSVDLQDRYGEFQIQFGMSSTPILHDGVLYLQLIHGSMRDRSTTSEGTVVALDAATGKEKWKQVRATDGHTENKHSYASPTLVIDGDTKYLVTHGGDYVIGHALKDGAEIWRKGGLNPKDNYNPYLRFVASPVAADGKLIVPSAKNGPVICLDTNTTTDATGDSQTPQWVLRQGTPDVATPVVHDGLVFLARENGVMLCVDAETGEEVYQKRMFADKHRSTPVCADGKLYIVARDGTVVVLSADREGTVLAENDLGDVGKASPAIVDGKVYIRTSKGLYCFANE